MDIEYIKNIIQTILNKEFQKNPSKRVIIEHNDRLNFACPYCGDSAKNNVAKRGNLYLNRLFYVCFNCDKKTSFSKMCKDFDIVIDPDKKIEMNDYIDNNIRYTDYADDFLNAKTVNLINLDRLTKTLNNGSTNITEFKPVVFNSIVYNYLISRGIPQKYHTNIYQAKYWIGNNYQWVICILNRRDISFVIFKNATILLKSLASGVYKAKVVIIRLSISFDFTRNFFSLTSTFFRFSIFLSFKAFKQTSKASTTSNPSFSTSLFISFNFSSYGFNIIQISL